MPTTLLLSPRIFRPFYGPALSIPYEITPPSIARHNGVKAVLKLYLNIFKLFYSLLAFSFS